MTAQRFDATGDEDLDLRTGDDAFNVERVPTRSALDDLRSDLATPVEREPLDLDIPAREGIRVSFNTSLDGELLNGWRKRCTPRKGGMDNFDDLKFACLVLANQAEDVIRRGVSTGLNFRDHELLDMLKANGALDGVRKLFAVDGHVLVAGAKVLEACGYSDDFEDAEDPTTAR